MNTKQYVLGLVAGASMLGGCLYATRDGNLKDTGIQIPINRDPNDPKYVQMAQLNNIGKALVRTLEDEYDKVEYYLKGKEDDPNLIIWGFEKDGKDYRPVCGINIDNLCDVYLRGRSVVEYLLGKDVIAFPSTGEIINCRMSKGTAEYLDKFLHEYIDVNNTKICESWKLFIKENIGPRG